MVANQPIGHAHRRIDRLAQDGHIVEVGGDFGDAARHLAGLDARAARGQIRHQLINSCRQAGLFCYHAGDEH